MNTWLWLTVGVLVLCAFIFFVLYERDFFSNNNNTSDSMNIDKTKSLGKKSDIILDYKKLIIPESEIERKEDGYKPDEEAEWVIDIELVNGEIFTMSELSKVLDYDWNGSLTSTFYGYNRIEKRWTYAHTDESSDVYTQLQVAIDLKEVFLESRSDYDPLILKQYLVEISEIFKRGLIKVNLKPKETVESAVSKAKRIIDLYNENLYDAIIVLKSDTYYLEDDVWNTLESLGLEWGDGDLFHWGNRSEYGDQQNFSVWSTTGWGYFFPKNIRTKELNPKDLVFGFSVPRSADPKNIYEIMLKSVKYCQKHLGGILQDRNGNPFNEEMERAELHSRLERMKSYGFVPGSDKMLRMY